MAKRKTGISQHLIKLGKWTRKNNPNDQYTTGDYLDEDNIDKTYLACSLHARAVDQFSLPKSKNWLVGVLVLISLALMGYRMVQKRGDLQAISPPNGATGMPSKTTLHWKSLKGVREYVVYLNDKKAKITRSTQIDLTDLLPGRKYIWQIEANIYGSKQKSQPWTFTTDLDKPAGGFVVFQKDEVFLKWNPVRGAESYKVFWGLEKKNLDFSMDSSTPIFRLSDLKPGQKYNWQVEAFTRDAKSKSEGWSFIMPLSKPTLLYPLPFAESVELPVLLRWRAVKGATSYEVVWGTDPVLLRWRAVKGATSYEVVWGTDPALSNNKMLKVSALSLLLPHLKGGDKYYWRVDGLSPYTKSKGEVFSFTTVALDRAIDPFPAHKAKKVSLSPTLSWKAVSGATSYSVYISTNSTFQEIEEMGSPLIPKYPLSGLSANTTYYWRVDAYKNNKSVKGTTWQFQTGK